MSQLSAGICTRLVNASADDNDLFNAGHTVQFVSIKNIGSAATSNSTTDRFRIVFSDGEHALQAMLATQLNSLVVEGHIVKNAIVVVEKLTCNLLQGKRLFIILALRVLSTDQDRIGNPVSITQRDDSEPNPSTTAAASSSKPREVQQQQPQQPPPRQQASGRSARTVFPIEGLSPYQNNWTIKARVTQKSEIKTWSNQRGEGKLFNVTLMDESGEIRATGFNAQVDDFYDKLEEGKVYFISKARVNLAKKKFSNLTNDYELGLDRTTEIEECLETTNLPSIKYNFVQLAGLEDLAKDATCDVLGVLKEAGPLGEITSKTTNRTIQKRELTLVDKSNYSTRLTLWGKQAEQFNCEENQVIAFKGVKVGDFGGRSLSMISSSTMTINPDHEEAFGLKGWYDAVGTQQSFHSHTNAISSGGLQGPFNRAEIRTLKSVKDDQLGQSDKVDYFSTRATIMHIKSENISYPACPTQGCNKKVVQVSDGWKCEKCDRNFERPEHRYIVSLAAADWSGQAWLQGFNDAGLAIFGMPANDLVDIKERDETEYNGIMQKANCSTFNFSCRAKLDTYNDQPRVRYGISRIMPLEYREEACALRDLLQSAWGR